MIMNQTPYPLSFEQQMSQALVCRYGEEMRQYVFKPDIDVSGLSCLLQIAKTDGTFTENGVEVHTDPDTGDCTLVITIPQQATVVKGLNRYSICVYGPIEGEDHLLYSAEGPLWVDDNLITDDMIQSVAEVNGVVFPQDFLTVDNLVDIVNYVAAEIIKDDTTSDSTTWSSQKISDEIEGHTPDIDVSKEVTGNPIVLDDGADAPLIRCVTQITGYQEGTGTPSPDNIRPIVAYSSGTVEVEDGDGNVTTHTTTYPSAIYRGSEDVVNGSVESAKVLLTLNTATMDNTNQNYAGWRSSGIRALLGAGINRSFTNQILNIGDTFGVNTEDNYDILFLAKSVYGLTQDEWKALAIDVQIVVELPTPTTEQVTVSNLPIRTLSGYNHIESSTGEMEVEYLTWTYDPIADLIDRSAIHVYSTEEKVVGKWIDGRPIYERTFEVNNITSDGVQTLDANGTPSNIQMVPGCAVVMRTRGTYNTDYGVSIASEQSGCRLISNVNGLGVSIVGYSMFTSQYGTCTIWALVRYVKA